MANTEKTVELTYPQKAAAVIVSLGAEQEVDGRLTAESLLQHRPGVLQATLGDRLVGHAALVELLQHRLRGLRVQHSQAGDLQGECLHVLRLHVLVLALVLSYVDPSKAAGVIEQLPPDRQIKVVEAIATMESASPAAIKIIEKEMERKFSSIVTSSNVKVGGIDYVASIMNNLDRSSEKSIFDGLNVNNAELADEIRKRMFVFEDIITLDDRAVQRVLANCDQRDVVLALKSANSEVSNKLFSNMSARLAESIRNCSASSRACFRISSAWSWAYCTGVSGPGGARWGSGASGSGSSGGSSASSSPRCPTSSSATCPPVWRRASGTTWRSRPTCA